MTVVTPGPVPHSVTVAGPDAVIPGAWCTCGWTVAADDSGFGRLLMAAAEHVSS